MLLEVVGSTPTPRAYAPSVVQLTRTRLRAGKTRLGDGGPPVEGAPTVGSSIVERRACPEMEVQILPRGPMSAIRLIFSPETKEVLICPIDRMYIIVRNDLKPGLQAAQACHALRLFGAEHPEEDRSWYEGSNNLVLLQVPDEEALLGLLERSSGISSSLFREPDLGDEATALALEARGRRLVSNLPLLLR